MAHDRKPARGSRRQLPAVAALLAATCISLPAAAQPAERAAAPQDRTAMELTVYNGNLALVRETRRVSLTKGVNSLALTGVSPAMQPATASVTVQAQKPVTQIDQTFAFDLLTPEALLRHSVGNAVRVIRTNPATGEETTESAKVLSARDGVILQIGDRIETGIPGRIVYDALPPTLREKPTLLATVEAAAAEPATLDLRYLTGGVSWQADYLAELDKNGSSLSVQAVATLTNNSGATYEDATLRLVAGTINQGPVGFRPEMMRTMAAKDAAAAAPVPSQPVGDMHVYPIPRKTTLADRETRQIVLFESARVPVAREYRLVGNGGFHLRRVPEPVTVNAERLLRFKNDKPAGLGVPMPAGTFRVYGGTGDAADTFLGADHIQHTAAGGEVVLDLGQAFDITARRVQTDYRTQGLPKNASESAHEIKLRNASASAVTVKIVEHLPGDWEILKSSQPFKKASSNRAEWSIEIPANGERTLTYEARVQR
ncbi:MAG: DUF4139 domain-containing protein [Alphaproteobacteria bacterium]|nr:DUF4139 domain-containing protein [Alphaproteobacteria bacterium]